MTLRTLIVDDEPPARRRLRALLESDAEVLGTTIVGEAVDGASAIEAITRLRPDLVLRDIQMPGADGFDVVAEIAARIPSAAPAVVFVTAWDQYALQAFDAQAVDYLLKPFDRERLRKAIDRVRSLSSAQSAERLATIAAATRGRQTLRRLVIRGEGRVTFVPVDDVDYVEAAGHYAVVHVGSATHIVRDTIAALAARLDPEHFARIHRGTIVNLDRVKELVPWSHGEFDVVLASGSRLRATRTYAAALIKPDR